MRPLTCLRVLAAIYLIACVELSSGAEVGLSHQGGTDLIIFSGEIKTGDSDRVQPIINQIIGNGNIHRFVIHSQGGNVTEAMKIGDLLRSNRISVFEPKGVSCISACVFAIMGGTSRVIEGRIGLHHPLFLNVPADNPRVQQLLAEGKRSMMRYAQKMNVNPQIVEDMYTLPNEGEIKYLNQNEVSAYRLSTERQ